MGEVHFNVSIPLDEDEFIEMECDFCKGRFMIHKDTYENDENIHFFCPICGLPNRVDTFFCPEVLERAQQEAANYAMELLDKELSRSIRQINKSGFLKMSVNKTGRTMPKELYTPTDSYEIIHEDCCGVDVKIQNFDQEIGIYCPICGRDNL